jgi:predicted methyltransferase
MIGGLDVATIAFALAACALTIAVVELLDRLLHWIEDRREVRDQPQRDEVQLLLALLCEQMHERLQRDGTPPRTVINLTAGQWHEVIKR